MATITRNIIRARSIKAILTNAEVLTLPTAAITLVAAVANRAYIFKRALLMADDAGGAWTNVDAAGYLKIFLGAIGVIATSSFGSQRILASDGLIGTGIRTTILGQYSQDTSASTPETMVDHSDALSSAELTNVALSIGAANAAAGNFTGGNAANTLTAYVYYDEIRFA